MYDDSMQVVKEMRAAGLRVGIVSDAWPSLDRRYRMLGVREHFDPFVISALVGTTKPDPRIFGVALDHHVNPYPAQGRPPMMFFSQISASE